MAHYTLDLIFLQLYISYDQDEYTLGILVQRVFSSWYTGPLPKFGCFGIFMIYIWYIFVPRKTWTKEICWRRYFVLYTFGIICQFRFQNVEEKLHDNKLVGNVKVILRVSFKLVCATIAMQVILSLSLLMPVKWQICNTIKVLDYATLISEVQDLQERIFHDNILRFSGLVWHTLTFVFWFHRGIVSYLKRIMFTGQHFVNLILDS